MFFALKGCALWLERMNVDSKRIVVVTIKPESSKGIGLLSEHGAWSHIETDEYAELVREDVVKFFDESMTREDDDHKSFIVDSVARGALLQALVEPSIGSILLRLVSGQKSATLTQTVMPDFGK